MINDIVAVILLFILVFSYEAVGGGINIRVDGMQHSFSWSLEK